MGSVWGRAGERERHTHTHTHQALAEFPKFFENEFSKALVCL